MRFAKTQQFDPHAPFHRTVDGDVVAACFTKLPSIVLERFVSLHLDCIILRFPMQFLTLASLACHLGWYVWNVRSSDPSEIAVRFV